MNDLSKYVELYRMTTEHDTEVLWSKVAIIREAVASGADVETLLSECGRESGDSRKQVRKFYAVAMVFDEDDAAKDHDYWIYEVCATAPGIEIDNPSTYHIGWSWLDKSLQGREIKRGKTTIHAKHTARTLRRAIREAAQTGSAKPKAEVVFKGEAFYLGYDVFRTRVEITLDLPCDITSAQLQALDYRDVVTLTITRTPQPDSANAAVNEGSKVA